MAPFGRIGRGGTGESQGMARDEAATCSAMSVSKTSLDDASLEDGTAEGRSNTGMSNDQDRISQDLARVPLGWTSRDWLSYWTRDDAEHEKSHHLHFWAPVEPLDNSTLIVSPLKRSEGITGLLRFYNSNGTLVSESSIAARHGQLAQLPLSAFLDGCETDQGFRHSHLELITSCECQGEIQFSSRLRSSFLTAAHRLSERESRAVPLTLSTNSRHVVALINPHDVQCVVKCRLFVGTRSPEEVCLLPPHGTVLISPEVLYASVINDLNKKKNTERSVGGQGAQKRSGSRDASKRAPHGRHFSGPMQGRNDALQAYLKLTTRSGKSLGYQILEERSFGQDGRTYGVLS